MRNNRRKRQKQLTKLFGSVGIDCMCTRCFADGNTYYFQCETCQRITPYCFAYVWADYQHCNDCAQWIDKVSSKQKPKELKG